MRYSNSDGAISAYNTEDFSQRVTIKDCDGNPLDITDWTIYLTIKRKETDLDADALVQIINGPGDHVDPMNGITILQASRDEFVDANGSYYYDVKAKNANDQMKVLIKSHITYSIGITQTDA